MEYRGCVPLKERVKRRDAQRREAEGMELRIRMGWKPIPTPVRHQTLENEPPMYVACDIAELNKIIEVVGNLVCTEADRVADDLIAVALRFGDELAQRIVAAEARVARVLLRESAVVSAGAPTDEYVACDIAELNKIIDKMHEMGVGKAELCLVGWGPGGHDGRFPQQYHALCRAAQCVAALDALLQRYAAAVFHLLLRRAG